MQNHISGTVHWQEYRISWVGVKQRWGFMQRQCRVQKGSHQGLVALGEQGRITAAQFTDKGDAGLLL